MPVFRRIDYQIATPGIAGTAVRTRRLEGVALQRPRAVDR